MKYKCDRFMNAEKFFADILTSNDFEKRIKEQVLEFIPELKQQIGFDQNNPHHHLTLWEHTMKVIEGTPRCDFIGRLIALLHDISKPVSNKYLEDKGKTVYYNHDADGVPIAYNILYRLGFSDDIINKVCLSIALHRRVHDKNLDVYKRLDEANVLQSFINMAIADVLAHKVPNEDTINCMKEIYYNGFNCFNPIKRNTNIITKDNMIEKVIKESPSKLAIFLIGEPRSGKSTVSNILKDSAIILSADEIRKEVFNVSFDVKVEKEVWEIFEKELNNNITFENKIVIDNTNISVKARRHYLNILKSKGYSVVCINMETSIPTLMRRCEDTGFNKNICARFIVNKERGAYIEFDKSFDMKE